MERIVFIGEIQQLEKVVSFVPSPKVDLFVDPVNGFSIVHLRDIQWSVLWMYVSVLQQARYEIGGASIEPLPAFGAEIPTFRSALLR